jgi:hypothetical protein
MMVEDVMELLPSIYQRSSALQTLISGSSGAVSSDADVSKKPAAKGKKKVSPKLAKTTKPAKEKKKKAQKATVVKNSTISIPKMVNDTTISTSDPTIRVSEVASKLPSMSSNLLSNLAAAASEAPAVAETSTTAVAKEAAETPTTSFGKFDATPTELQFDNNQAQNLVDEGGNDDVPDSADKGDKLCCSYKKCNNARATKEKIACAVTTCREKIHVTCFHHYITQASFDFEVIDDVFCCATKACCSKFRVGNQGSSTCWDSDGPNGPNTVPNSETVLIDWWMTGDN